MSEQTREQITDKLRERLSGRTISSVEYVGEGIHGEDSDYVVIHLEGDITLYANAPSLYVPVTEERTFLEVCFDVTDLSEEERGALALEVSVQAEESDFVGDDGHGWSGHQGVEAPEIEFVTKEVQR